MAKDLSQFETTSTDEESQFLEDLYNKTQTNKPLTGQSFQSKTTQSPTIPTQTAQTEDAETNAIYEKIINSAPENKSANLSIVMNEVEKEKSKLNKFASFFSEGYMDYSKGFGKGVLSTVRGASSLGERGLDTALKTILPKSLEPKFGLDKEKSFTSAEKLIPETYVTPEGTMQNIGYVAEQIAEFFLPGGASTKLAKATKFSKTGQLLTKMGTEASIAGGQTAIKEGDFNEESKTNAIVGALFPLVGKGLSATKPILGRVGEKISQSIIRPNATDLADGFDIKNVQKYKVGGALKDTIAKTHIELNKLGNELRLKLVNAKEKPIINLNKVLEATERELQRTKGLSFGDVGATKRVIEQVKNEIAEQADETGIVDLITANEIKRGAGTKGAWAYNRPEPDASATEKVYTTFYNKLKETIEMKAPEGVKEINKKMSELIPISNAALRRLPVEQRNNILSLTDSIGLFSAIFDPRALALIGANRLSKSGKFGEFLMNVAEQAKKPSKTVTGERFFGK